MRSTIRLCGFVQLACMVTILIVGSHASAKQHMEIRFNRAGYLPSAPKRLIVMANESCDGMKCLVTEKVHGTQRLSAPLAKPIAGNDEFSPMKFNYVIDFSPIADTGVYVFSIDDSTRIELTVGISRYRSVVHDMLHFLKAMRSASPLTVDHAPAHFGDSACSVYRRSGDRPTDTWQVRPGESAINMLGGWYEGMSYVKYTLTNAYTAYFLLASYEAFPSLFEKRASASDLPDILDEASFGLRYLMKTMPTPQDFIIQVGSFADEQQGVRLPQDDPRDGKRQCYSILSSPQMALAAAALALGSSVFSSVGKNVEAQQYKEYALKIFASAITKEAATPAWLEAEYSMQKDENGFDNILLAAAELYRLTKDAKYLAIARNYSAVAKNGQWASYSQVNMFGHNRIMDINPLSKTHFLADLNLFLNHARRSGNVFSMPQQYAYMSIYSFSEAANGALLYTIASRSGNDSAAAAGAAKSVGSDTTYEKMAVAIADYIYGANPWGVSFVASQAFEGGVSKSAVPVYLLQSKLFPTGAVAFGPCDGQTYDGQPNWRFFDPKTMPSFQFNTNKVRFFDHEDDYLCMGSTISGIADNMYLVSLLLKLYEK
ncbi:MAG: glycoside hydrolase family 9 protein [Chitinivibrionales bacterium]|nr:glycoside hydrolase family 9 protein [Chitinivibrionales bacterium]